MTRRNGGERAPTMQRCSMTPATFWPESSSLFFAFPIDQRHIRSATARCLNHEFYISLLEMLEGSTGIHSLSHDSNFRSYKIIDCHSPEELPSLVFNTQHSTLLNSDLKMAASSPKAAQGYSSFTTRASAYNTSLSPTVPSRYK